VGISARVDTWATLKIPHVRVTFEYRIARVPLSVELTDVLIYTLGSRRQAILAIAFCDSFKSKTRVSERSAPVPDNRENFKFQLTLFAQYGMWRTWTRTLKSKPIRM
jgi:hypothetical protein